MLKIEFENPNKRLETAEKKEVRSKLLKVDSDLYRRATELREKIKAKFGNLVDSQRMDFHIELIRKDPTEDKLITRAQSLEGQLIDTTVFETTPKSIGIKCPFVEDYGYTHCTLAYFPLGLPHDILYTVSN
jgi:hypothetical protein